MMNSPPWIAWAKRLQTMSQTGLTYARDPYDIERYREIAEISLEMFAAGSELELPVLRDLFAAERGHATPKVDVRVAAFRDETILLVRERSDGLWTLPGGWADVGESASEGATREVLEESGFEVRVTRLLALYDKRLHGHPPDAYYIYKIIFEATIVGGAARASDETDDVGFFSADSLPPLSLRRILPSQIARAFELHADPAAPAIFD
jgi:ADP-ribose pyrophosphatase YjhB (NUDIX family)